MAFTASQAGYAHTVGRHFGARSMKDGQQNQTLSFAGGRLSVEKGALGNRATGFAREKAFAAPGLSGIGAA